MSAARTQSARLLRVGDQAPGFSLPDHDGQTVTLQEFRGRNNVVLVFYPRDNTPGCTKQLCAIRDEFDLFANDDAAVLGISPQDAASHRRFVDRHGFPFRLLVNRDRTVVSAYGCRGTLATKRTVYGIDKEGTIVFARRGMPTSEDILKAFKEE